MNDEFTWSRLKIFFPEYFLGNTEEFPIAPTIKGDRIHFQLSDYGVEVYINQKIPQWLKGVPSVEPLYHAHAKSVLKELRPELEDVLPVVDKWRPNLKYLVGNGWYFGHLEKDVEFVHLRGHGGVSYLDYWVMEEKNSRGIPMHPTDKILAIGKLPEDSINPESKRFYDLSKRVIHISGTNCNEVSGASLIECATIADEIYGSVPELEKVKIRVL
jgi:hypothetical protein